MRFTRIALIVAVFVFLSAPTFGQATKKPATIPAFARVTDDPALPRVLLIGDSISIGYTLPTRELLKGKANVHRPAINCGPTTRGVEKMQSWIGEKKWDVIHFNFGLHDLKYVDDQATNAAPEKGHQQVPLDQYEKNLEQIVRTLKPACTQLIFATTTPVPAGEPQRVYGDAVKYNEAARRVMERNGVKIDDLYGFCLPIVEKIQKPKNVHFTDEGYQLLAEQVAREIEDVLPPQAATRDNPSR